MERIDNYGRSAYNRAMQCSEILEMNVQDLSEYLKKLEMENPLVELRGGCDEDRSVEEDRRRKLEWLEESDVQNRVYYEQVMEDSEDPEDWKVPISTEDSPAEFLCLQLYPSCHDPKEREVIYFLANSLDERGYLTEDIRNVAKRFGIREADANRCLYLLQSADPAGIGARNLRECLLLQLDRMAQDLVIPRRIVLECLELLGDNRIAKIAIRLGISLEDAEESCQIIRGLNPKPGSCFSARQTLRYLLPDVTVVRFQDYYQILLNDTGYPKIHMNSYYKKLMKSEDVSEEVVDYIRSQMSQATWVREMIDRRGRMLTEVTKALVQCQKTFFEKGTEYRRTITWEELMRMTGFSRSELEALVKDKYIQCHWGVFPLAFLLAKADNVLSSGMLSDDSTAVLAKKTRRQVIAKEDKRHPYSDQRITDRLNAMGIAISRRTVAKYRSQLGIREASGRREWPE